MSFGDTSQVGNRYGRLLVVGRADGANRASVWQCLCDCGAEVVLPLSRMIRGNTRSCGCLRREMTAAKQRTHGATDTRAYRSWAGMMRRCTNKNDQRWPLYGGRGIKVCDRWTDAANFIQDMGQPPAGHSLDRIDVNGNYEPSNCRWATQKQQNRNTRRTKYAEFDGVILPLREWAELLNIPYSMLRDRLARGWDFRRAATEPRQCPSST